MPGRPASKISFYISEHGYGHATRSIALVRSLAARGNGELRIEVVNHHAAPLLARALAGLGGVSFVDRPTDVGFLCRQDRLEFDRGRTAMRVAAWVGGWKEFVASETARLASDRPDLILSDVAPEPLLVAAKLGVRSTVVSNFSWADQYEPHLRGDLVSPIRGAYTLADRWHAYAMRTPLAGIPRVVAAGLVTREPRASREEARARLGISAAEPLVHVGLGWTPDAVAAVGLLDAGSSLPDAALLLSSNLAGLTGLRGFRKVYAIPDDDTEAHEAIAACDLVVAKAGYGTVAEAIAARVPIVAIPITGSLESGVIAREVERLGIGISAPPEGLEDGTVFARAADAFERLESFHAAYRRLPAEYAPGAADRLARVLLEELAGQAPSR